MRAVGRIRARVDYTTARRSGSRAIRIIHLGVTAIPGATSGVPIGARVTLVCQRGCSRQDRWVTQARNGSRESTKFRGLTVQAGARILLTIRRPRWIGLYESLTAEVKTDVPFVVSFACLPPTGPATPHPCSIYSIEPPPPSPPPPPPPPAGTLAETTGGETHTWTDYTNAGGTEGPTIPGGTTVQVSCKRVGFAVADGNTWWYRIASDPWNDKYYASADAFYNNGATSGPLNGTPYVDPAVPDCPAT